MAKKHQDVTSDRMQKCLQGVSYPADKDQLIQHAKNTCGDEAVISALKDLPAQSYGGSQDLTQSLTGILGSGIHLRLDI